MHSVRSGDPSVMEIEWLPHNKCNFKCSSCHEDLNSGTSLFPSLDNSLRFFNFLNDEINPNKKFLSISGGEPTLWPNLSEFVNLIDKSYRVSIVTNGSRTINWWSTFVSKTPTLLGVTISVHFEFADLNHTINVIEMISKIYNVTVLILYKPEYKELIKDFLSKLVSNNYKINILINPIRNVYGKSIDYDIEDQEFIKTFYYNKSETLHDPFWDFYVDEKKEKSNYIKHLIANKLTKFKGWYCNIGKNRLCIWHDGSIYPANCLTAKKYYLGNINDSEIIKLNGAICENDYCGCLPDVKVPKWKTDV